MQKLRNLLRDLGLFGNAAWVFGIPSGAIEVFRWIKSVKPPSLDFVDGVLLVSIVLAVVRVLMWVHSEWSSYKRFREWVEYSDTGMAFNTHPNPMPHRSLETKMIALAKWRVKTDVSRAARMSDDD